MLSPLNILFIITACFSMVTSAVLMVSNLNDKSSHNYVLPTLNVTMYILAIVIGGGYILYKNHTAQAMTSLY